MKRLATAAVAAVLLLAPAAAQEALKSEACKLLTAEEAAKILGHTVMNGDDGAEANGMSSCGWVDEETFNAIVFIVSSGVALGGQDAGAYFDATRQAQTQLGKVEDVSGIGEKAYLYTDTSTPDPSASKMLSLTFAKGGKVVVVNSTGVEPDKLKEAATIIAGRS